MYTLTGSLTFEKSIHEAVFDFAHDVQKILPARQLQAMILGGGYGRGEGGVYRINGQELLYNDLEFYVVTKSHPRLVECLYSKAIHQVCEAHSQKRGVEFEIKFIHSKQLEDHHVSMFLYDLASRHKVILGDKSILENYSHLCDASLIPLSEAIRLGMNRGTGLLLSKGLMTRKGQISSADIPFIERNMAKAELAVGDMLLTKFGLYHWSCLERNRRLKSLRIDHPNLPQILQCHDRGVQFKLHPKHSSQLNDSIHEGFHNVCRLLFEMWLEVERERLRRTFRSIEDYVLSAESTCPDRRYLKNLVLNVRALGWRGLLKPSIRYPRDRLLRTLPVLLWLWKDHPGRQISRVTQTSLAVPRGDWDGLVAAYLNVWKRFN